MYVCSKNIEIVKHIFFIALSIIVNWMIVFIGNGTSSVFTLLFFVTITYGAWKFGAIGGLITGILSGIIVGPFMPLNVAEQVAQPLYNWLLRLVIFSGYGYGMGRFIQQLIITSGYDTLMEIPNRKSFYDHLTVELRHMFKPFYIILINIDDFKSINDSIGHSAADLLLIEIKKRIASCIQKHDYLARWSGDEFSIILYRENETKLINTCDKMYQVLQAPYKINEHDFFINASIGVSTISTKDKSKDLLLKEAETAMRFVKERGKNGYKFYNEEMDRNSLQEKLLEATLHKALNDGTFEIHYQPKILCKTKQIYGAEALLRLRNQTGDFISPAQFIPVAEKTGLIIPIGKWVLQTACEQIKKWHNQNINNICLSVNVSAIQIQADDFVDSVSNILTEYDVDPSLIELEITESSIMEDSIENIMKLNELKDIGVRISLDDFGKGYSSLNYLKILPIDTLKVDKSFIQNIEYDPREKAITDSIVQMAKALGLTVLAEGIENETQYLLLRELGCDAMQGFYFWRPLPINELEKLILPHSLLTSSQK